MTPPITDQWSSGEAYEAYMGRWSRLVATKFLAWLSPRAGLDWLDLGCGTGALTATVLATADPRSITGIDQSAPFIATARSAIDDSRAIFEIADARSIPLQDKSVDIAVSGLCLNFVPEPHQAIAELARITRPGGAIAVYVWDYAGEMQMLRRFWEAAKRVDPSLTVDEGHRNPLCAPGPLQALFEGAGLRDVTVTGIEIDTRFIDFADYWQPFQAGTGPAPAYLRQLDPEQHAALEAELHRTLPTASDGLIPLIARAWAVQGRR